MQVTTSSLKFHFYIFIFIILQLHLNDLEVENIGFESYCMLPVVLLYLLRKWHSEKYCE